MMTKKKIMKKKMMMMVMMIVTVMKMRTMMTWESMNSMVDLNPEEKYTISSRHARNGYVSS